MVSCKLTMDDIGSTYSGSSLARLAGVCLGLGRSLLRGRGSLPGDSGLLRRSGFGCGLDLGRFLLGSLSLLGLFGGGAGLLELDWARLACKVSVSS